MPNKGFYQFIQTPSIAFRCIILFPDTSPSLQRFVIGWPFQTKEKALKSAAFQAVRLLKKEGLLKDDLRPSHAEEL